MDIYVQSELVGNCLALKHLHFWKCFGLHGSFESFVTIMISLFFFFYLSFHRPNEIALLCGDIVLIVEYMECVFKQGHSTHIQQVVSERKKRIDICDRHI